MTFLSAKIGIFLKTLGWQGEESVGRAPIFNVYLEKKHKNPTGKVTHQILFLSKKALLPKPLLQARRP